MCLGEGGGGGELVDGRRVERRVENKLVVFLCTCLQFIFMVHT